ncbi:DNA repair protein RecO [Henriciella pelagia]|jgi:DNA repair protein RecO (recombination protein O)|uniref:DNA repair protein RecO n=1 Tax=Henriciella pelagia TaxID=1977912 RepID=A0ABQ1J2X3_9PROT|nr:DNA repair protein RecO [Henriciella pelagia]GGB58428.1 DNA repair protein RecO [Henriciella pelagia]
MQWRDEGLILGGRKFGESGLILDVLTRTRGRRSGLVYGGASRKKRPQFEPGNSVDLSWSGRLEEQLGRFDVAEATRSRTARLIDLPEALLAVASIAALLRGTLNEGDQAGSYLFEATEMLLDSLEDGEVWPALYVRWELGLLSALGFGLDLDACAISGENDGLTHVSPKTGRAVRGSEAEEYVDRLLALPAFLIDPKQPASAADVAAGLELTGVFIERRLFHTNNRDMPEPRRRLYARLQKRT